MRRAVTEVSPQVEEVMRRGVPAFRYLGQPLVSIGAAQRHVALYVMYGRVLQDLAEDLEPYDASRTVVRFPPDEALPDDLIFRILVARKAEIDGASSSPEPATK
ncbi:iron chaperone [Egibacter rhizosphaerae]|uniref:iron chaperone n=1 Tax=Egibacter rhizosphaerae TaxID=1670831 RepID=UPI00197AA69D|nr:DUF1801 domain-containing protein [Egibacter rhizosphaerae]